MGKSEEAVERRVDPLVRSFRVDDWLLEQFDLFTYWIDAGPGGLGWDSQDGELKKQYEDVLAWITRTIMPPPGSGGMVAGTPIRTWEDGSIWIIQTGRAPKKIGMYPNNPLCDSADNNMTGGEPAGKDRK